MSNQTLGQDTAELAGPKDAPAFHQPFSWVHVPAPGLDAHFAALTLNVCRGVETCLQLMHSTDLAMHAREWEEDETPVLSRVDKEKLMLLATAAMQMLGDRAERRVNDANEKARQVAQAAGRA